MDARTERSNVAAVIARILGPDLPIAIQTYDGGRIGPSDAPATLVVRSPNALRRMLTAPGELGVGRAYVVGDLDLEGDVFAALSSMRSRLPRLRLGPATLVELGRLLGPEALRPLPPPPEEARLHGRRHSRSRDADAIAHHYDVSNRFYELVLGPSMTYSCAVWPNAVPVGGRRSPVGSLPEPPTAPEATLEQAQAEKHELVCRKLGLEPGMRLLDIGCGWGGMAMHATSRHGVSVVGVTLSRRQVEWASKAVADAGLADRVEIRLQDYRDVRDGPFDAISSIGMFEHVGQRNLARYFRRLHRVLRPGGRLLNHGISRPAVPNGRMRAGVPVTPARISRRSFIDRFVFPDGELHEVGAVVSTMQGAGFEVRHVESLREHYALTLRSWAANLEGHWDEAVAEAGLPRAKIWRLYMAASALNFEADRTQVHQVLAVRPDRGRSGLPLRPAF